MGRYSPTVLPRYDEVDPVDAFTRAFQGGYGLVSGVRDRSERRALERRRADQDDERLLLDSRRLDQSQDREMREEEESALKYATDPNLRDVTDMPDPARQLEAAFNASSMMQGNLPPPTRVRIPNLQTRAQFGRRDYAIDPNWRARGEARQAIPAAVEAGKIAPEEQAYYERLPEMFLEEIRPKIYSTADRLAVGDQRGQQRTGQIGQQHQNRLEEIERGGEESRKTAVVQGEQSRQTKAVAPGRAPSVRDDQQDKREDEADAIEISQIDAEIRALDPQLDRDEISRLRTERRTLTQRRSQRLRGGSALPTAGAKPDPQQAAPDASEARHQADLRAIEAQRLQQDAEKALSRRDLWEKKVKEGMTPEQATAYVQRWKPR